MHIRHAPLRPLKAPLTAFSTDCNRRGRGTQAPALLVGGEMQWKFLATSRSIPYVTRCWFLQNCPPSPPPAHELFKRVRQGPSAFESVLHGRPSLRPLRFLLLTKSCNKLLHVGFQVSGLVAVEGDGDGCLAKVKVQQWPCGRHAPHYDT